MSRGWGRPPRAIRVSSAFAAPTVSAPAQGAYVTFTPQTGSHITRTTGDGGGSGGRASAAGPASSLRLRPCPLPDLLPTTLFPLLSLPVGRGVCGVAVRLGFGVTRARSESGVALPLTLRTAPAQGQLIASGSSPAGGGVCAPCVCADPFWAVSGELKELPSSLMDKQTFHLSFASQDGLDLESGACVGGWVHPRGGWWRWSAPLSLPSREAW